MLLVPFKVGKNKYALNSDQIIEIIPRINLREIHKAPNFVAGMFNYRGHVIPVIDLCSLIAGYLSANCLGTRIIIVEFSDNSKTCTFGIIAEEIIDIVSVSEDRLVPSGIKIEAAHYAGDIVTENDEIIQLVHIDKLINEPLKKMLFDNL